MPILKTLTLGCKVNQYETEYLRQGLARLGYRDARDGETADLGVVNTCTVTIEAEAKSRKLIRRFARQNPRAEIIVMGCYATRAAAEAARLPGVVEVVADKRQLPEVLARRGLVDIPTGISSFGRRHRAYVKVQDGCRMGCSYCIIPSVRPTLASRPVEEVLAEVRRLADGGHREIVLTGIHLGHYGLDFGDGRWNLARLLRTVVATGGSRVEGPESRAQARAGAITPLSPCGRGAGGEGDVAGATAGSPSSAKDTVGQANRGTQSTFADVVREPHQDFRVRLSSIEAAEVTPELLNFLAEFPQRACPHLHISMQSGSDAVLARMRRRWPVRQFIERCHEVTRRLDKPALTTDVIVGFPGETEEDFLATCRAVEEVGFSKLHVFRFSPRQGTPAATMPDHVPGNVQHCRASRLEEIGRRLRRAYFERLAGHRLQVLVETALTDRPGWLLGTSDRYAPVELPGGPELVGQLVDVVAGPVVGDRIRGR